MFVQIFKKHKCQVLHSCYTKVSILNGPFFWGGGGLTLLIKCPTTLGDCWYFFSHDFFVGPRLDKIFKDAFATILDNNLILRLVSENVFNFDSKPGSHHLLVL